MNVDQFVAWLQEEISETEARHQQWEDGENYVDDSWNDEEWASYRASDEFTYDGAFQDGYAAALQEVAAKVKNSNE